MVLLVSVEMWLGWWRGGFAAEPLGLEAHPSLGCRGGSVV